MTLYSSREPFNVWVSEVTGQRYANPPKYGHGRYFVEKQPQNNPTNRLLKAARRAQADGFLSDFLTGFLKHRNTEHAETDHAQRVLTRLANFQKEES